MKLGIACSRPMPVVRAPLNVNVPLRLMMPILPADDISRHDAILHSPGVMSRDSWTDEGGVALADELIDADHIEHGHAFGNGTDDF